MRCAWSEVRLLLDHRILFSDCCTQLGAGGDEIVVNLCRNGVISKFGDRAGKAENLGVGGFRASLQFVTLFNGFIKFRPQRDRRSAEVGFPDAAASRTARKGESGSIRSGEGTGFTVGPPKG